MLRNGETYLGWSVTFSESRPVTGKWRAERFGVGTCNGTAEGLKRMIDTRVREEEADRADREKDRLLSGERPAE